MNNNRDETFRQGFRMVFTESACQAYLNITGKPAIGCEVTMKGSLNHVNFSLKS